eukprot:3907858-Rhodomonas_salina.1
MDLGLTNYSCRLDRLPDLSGRRNERRNGSTSTPGSPLVWDCPDFWFRQGTVISLTGCPDWSSKL